MELWSKIEAAIYHRKRKTVSLSLFIRYVAVVAILFTATYYITNISFRKEVDYSSILSATQLPDGALENVTVILGDKEKIEIEDKDVLVSHDEYGNMCVNKKKIDLPESSSYEYNQLIVPYGKTTQITLSDGSSIWANSGTKLVYPVVFASDKREIYVEGEIYLEVARNEEHPFVVKTDMTEVNVLGTSFNVSAYKNDKQQFVTLVTGSVAIKITDKKNTTVIKPNQLYTFEKESHSTRLQEVDVNEYICWKDGFLIFHNESLAEVLKKIERYYNVVLVFDPVEISKVTVSGKLDLKSDINETFRIISITASIVYEKEENVIKISVKP
ncbi:iron dicitrate transporter FecR [Parabacteroides goldsteinii]|nr:iron dicitrate transporter FecR [Parabacteroides goldsteinii]GKG79473.1 iron dicitrate transporter FecR [Parabacteroides goldsteinii]